MKKNLLLLSTIATLALAGCGSNDGFRIKAERYGKSISMDEFTVGLAADALTAVNSEDSVLSKFVNLDTDERFVDSTFTSQEYNYHSEKIGNNILEETTYEDQLAIFDADKNIATIDAFQYSLHVDNHTTDEATHVQSLTLMEKTPILYLINNIEGTFKTDVYGVHAQEVVFGTDISQLLSITSAMNYFIAALSSVPGAMLEFYKADKANRYTIAATMTSWEEYEINNGVTVEEGSKSTVVYQFTYRDDCASVYIHAFEEVYYHVGDVPYHLVNDYQVFQRLTEEKVNLKEVDLSKLGYYA